MFRLVGIALFLVLCIGNSFAAFSKAHIDVRADIAIVSYALVKKILGDYPEYRDSLLISEKFDQEYHHTILLHQESPVTSNQINGYLDKLQRKGLLQQIWKTNHITDSL